jgi:hypothetical protein
MKKPVLLGVLFLAIVLGVIVYSSMNMSGFRVEVCMEYKGRTSCRTASGAQEDFALRTAISNACGEIASGVTDTIGCQSTPPKSVVWRNKR